MVAGALAPWAGQKPATIYEMASSVHDHGGTTDVFCGVCHGATPGGWQERLAHDMLGDVKERSPQGPREAT